MRRLAAAAIDDRDRLVVDTDPGVLLAWWSFTKTVIAALARKEVDAGRLDFDAPMPGRPFTARHALRYRAGVPEYGRLEAYHRATARREPAWTRDEMFERVRSHRLLFGPCSHVSCSDVGYLVLREHLERLSGEDSAGPIAERIEAPLSLRSVRLAVRIGDLATIVARGLADYDPGWVYHGCLLGTAAGAASILRGLVTGRLVRPQSVALMRERYSSGGAIAGRPWTAIGYGLGRVTGRIADAGDSVGD